MEDDKVIKDYKFIYLKNDYFKICTKNERLRNDIILVTFTDKTKECRIYMNTSHRYVVVPYDQVMIKEISSKTWTIDNVGRGSGEFVKCNKDNDNLKELLIRYGYENEKYTINDSYNDGISPKSYERKRKNFIKRNPLSNTGYING